jgi:response regulator RpfG family c-di-GMP phosphodiesterase
MLDDMVKDDVYKILIVDDEKTIHKITRMVLSKLTLDQKRLTYLSAYSAAEAKQVMEEHSDIAVILLDVVMEEEDSGLKLVKYIREELKNINVRIILRTGQPGYAPQKEVIMNYDINDYKEKNLLTSSQLYISVITALRSYRDIEELDVRQEKLVRALDATSHVLSLNNVEDMASKFLHQIKQFAKFYNAFALITTMFDEHGSNYEYLMDHGQLFGIGHYENITEDEAKDLYLPGIKACLHQCDISDEQCSFSNEILVTLDQSDGCRGLMYLYFDEDLTLHDRNLIELYSRNVLTTIQSTLASNKILEKQIEINNKNVEIIETQSELVMKLGEVVEYKSKETANHTNRVAEMAVIIAEEIGLSIEECELLRFSAPMHDVGKIGIEDKLLNKPGKLTPEEYEIIKSHSTIGYELFKSSKRELLNSCAIVSLHHHERWDGKGYPNGLKGEEIHLFGRIVALVDVFDALTHDRVYKPAWTVEAAKKYIASERGLRFDPEIVDAFMRSLSRLHQVLEALPS